MLHPGLLCDVRYQCFNYMVGKASKGLFIKILPRKITTRKAERLTAFA